MAAGVSSTRGPCGDTQPADNLGRRFCFVDLTGYTRLTEERGDEAAAQVAARLVALVNDISRRRGGQAVRWLGDGGMFYFREPGTAVVAGLDLVERGPPVDLPPAQVGIHTGPSSHRMETSTEAPSTWRLGSLLM